MRRWIAFILCAACALSGCTTVVTTRPGPRRAGPSVKVETLKPIRNNAVVHLREGVYRGDLDIRSNKVTLVGRGKRMTIIQGTVTVYGNNCSIQSLTITGDLILRGNNNDAVDATVRGRIVSFGNNNLW